MDLLWEWGSGTSSASSDEHLPISKNIYQLVIPIEDLGLPHFEDESGVQER